MSHSPNELLAKCNQLPASGINSSFTVPSTVPLERSTSSFFPFWKSIVNNGNGEIWQCKNMDTNCPENKRNWNHKTLYRDWLVYWPQTVTLLSHIRARSIDWLIMWVDKRNSQLWYIALIDWLIGHFRICYFDAWVQDGASRAYRLRISFWAQSYYGLRSSQEKYGINGL